MNMAAITEKCPLIAILRGIKTEEAEQYVSKLIELGYYFIEVPLNSPNALDTIRLLQQKFGDRCCIGAGTVTDVELLKQVLETGAKLIVTPNVNPEVIKLAKENGCIIFVGIMTPSEAFLAINSGAKLLKIFPAEIVGPVGFKAIKSVLPKDVSCFPVGGVKADTAQMQSYISLGAKGFGLGSALYSAGISFDQFTQNATNFQLAWQEVQK
ncbi:2-dehydro-3-deoxy-6-phosphogalactonate aldolase [Gallibacterium salpingitidis]|uniref:2-dehydro-3-deoxy-6-phosphogalactonate aldolase n=1 Tax=Gallibacterium salpingitidis TaxID=505341 RepID=A0A1A7NP91_9PAST|nr:2-dehydro-3-deoxy-6-phosphogalactonate aldolase [Gallibacterium salpingitidis]OBW91336.1 2-dehydro-3-deoxy-6-phosphogalactonate aldolase [Gallibacterium salpingitidis]